MDSMAPYQIPEHVEGCAVSSRSFHFSHNAYMHEEGAKFSALCEFLPLSHDACWHEEGGQPSAHVVSSRKEPRESVSISSKTTIQHIAIRSIFCY